MGMGHNTRVLGSKGSKMARECLQIKKGGSKRGLGKMAFWLVDFDDDFSMDIWHRIINL